MPSVMRLRRMMSPTSPLTANPQITPTSMSAAADP